MQHLKFKWLTNKRMYDSGETLYLNKIRVGRYEYNVNRTHNSKKELLYAGSILLPSLREDAVYSNTPEEIREKIEHKVTLWFDEALKE